MVSVPLSKSLLDSGRIGLVVLEPDQKIGACHGKLVDWLKPGQAATEALSILVGLEDVLEQMAGGELRSFSMPRVAWHESAVAERVLSLEIAPADEPGSLQLLLRDETEMAALEQEVIQRRNELSLANDALRKATMRAEQLLREKTALLANVSHDLKTPLQVIMGNAEILKNDLSEAERDGFLQDILDNSDFLLTLITDLLEASAIEAGQLELVEEPVDLKEMLERVLAMARQLPGGKSRNFERKGEAEVIVIRGDPMRLQRLLLNLVSNAVKFTDHGGQVTVRVYLEDDGDLMIDVSDDGCGIDPGLQASVFDPFARSGHAEGSGLGLHIAKGLANLHDAELSLASKPDRGTTISLRLPKGRLIEYRL